MKKTEKLLYGLLTAAGIIILLGIVWAGLNVYRSRSAEQDIDMKIIKEAAASTEIKTEIEIEVEAETEEDAVQESDEKKEINLLFGGDVLLSNYVLSAYDSAGGIGGIIDENIQKEIDNADIFMVNQEFPFSERGKAAPDKQYTFRLAPARAGILSEMGIDIVTLANNHALDFGTDALIDTCRTLEAAEIKYVGAGDNLDRAKKLEIIEAGKSKIGFLGASRVIPVGSWNAGNNTPGMLTTYDPEILVEEIGKAKEVCDYLIVYVHWGIERNTRPEDYQRNLGKKYIDAGADAVIGSHPHVVQGIEYYNESPIIYSLGNFVFGSSIPKTMLLRMKIGEDNMELSLIPCTSSNGYTTAVTDVSKTEEFYRYITELSYGVQVSADGTVSEISN